MISIIVWIVTYLIIAGYVFWYQCNQDKEEDFIHRRAGPVRCMFWAAIWPLALVFGALLVIYDRIVDGK